MRKKLKINRSYSTRSTRVLVLAPSSGRGSFSTTALLLSMVLVFPASLLASNSLAQAFGSECSRLFSSTTHPSLPTAPQTQLPTTRPKVKTPTGMAPNNRGTLSITDPDVIRAVDRLIELQFLIESQHFNSPDQQTIALQQFNGELKAFRDEIPDFLVYFKRRSFELKTRLQAQAELAEQARRKQNEHRQDVLREDLSRVRILEPMLLNEFQFPMNPPRSILRLLALSADGRHLAASADNTFARHYENQSQVILFDSSGRAPPVQFDHQAKVKGLAILKNKYLLTGGDDGLLRIFDVDTHQLLSKHKYGGGIDQLAASADSNLLAIGSSSQEVQIFDFPSRQLVERIKLPGLIKNLALAENGKLVLARILTEHFGLEEIYVFDRVKQKLSLLLRPESPSTAIAISEDGRLLAVGSEDQQMQLFSIEARHGLLGMFARHSAKLIYKEMYPSGTSKLAFSRDGQILATGFQTGEVKLFDLKSKTIMHEFKRHYDWVQDLALTDDGKRLASGSQRDGAARLYELYRKATLE